ncbi:MAG: hypothetical protein AAB410_03095 [Patescibacteria group bacterium]
MTNKNLDGIVFAKKNRAVFVSRPKISVIGQVRLAGNRPAVFHTVKPKTAMPAWHTFISRFWRLKIFSFSRPALALAVFVLALTFFAGLYSAWNTDQSFAGSQILGATNPPVLGASKLKVYEVPQSTVADVPNDIFFNLTLEQLEIYLAEVLKTPEMKEADRLAERKIKLKEYLRYRKSPFVEIVDTIAELKHWKLVLAVSNSESSLGKRCYNNNCSGIGVEPGHALWRDYKSKSDWAKDLDRLLEKRYKDWTLEEMNGIYNKPGSQNWLMASKQVLEELQERGIE